MKPLKVGSGGYTIIEVMFFLVISMAMFASVVTIVTTQNRRNQFTESVNTFNQKLQDIMNDIDTGYFPSNSNFTCRDPNPGSNSGTLNISTGAAEQGTNDQCTFIGKAFQLAPAGDASGFQVYTLVGAREYNEGGTKRPVTDLANAKVTPVSQSIVGGSDSGRLSSDVDVTRIVSNAGSQGGFAVLTGFAKNSATSASGVSTGNTKSTLSGVSGALGVDAATFQNQLNATGIVPSSEILVCLQERGGGRRATIQIGGAGVGQLSTQVTIDSTDSRCP